MQAAVSADRTRIHLLLLLCTPVPVCASLAMVELRACRAQLDGTRQLQAQQSVNLAQGRDKYRAAFIILRRMIWFFSKIS